MEFLGLKVELKHGVFRKLNFEQIWNNDYNG